MRIYISN